MKLQPRVALVVPALAMGGGVPGVAAFLYRVLSASGRYQPELISLATSFRDEASVRLLSPTSWTRGPQITEGVWQGKPFRHVGAFLTEFEFQRYRPRRVLTESLNEYDLVQVIAGAPAWALIGKEVRRPVVLQVATLISVERRARLRSSRGMRGLWRRLMTRITSCLDQVALRYVEAVFVENRWMYKRLQQLTDPNRVVFAPPGVDTKVFYPRLYRDHGHILSVGRFADPRKNVRMLFKAYHYLRRTMPQAPQLVLAGKSVPSPADWSVAVSLGVSDHIEVRRGVTVKELAELCRNASLFVLSSDEEGLGIVILEAMASGIPVISTRCGGPETAVVDGVTGYLTPVGDTEALALRMQELLENPSLRQQMGKAGREVAEDHFSLAAAGKVFLEKYDEILARGV